MYHTILVPLDGSKRAEAILPHVQKVARAGKSRVILLTALENRPIASSMNIQSNVGIGDAEQQLKSKKIYLDNLTEEMRRMDIQAESKVLSGPAVETIITVAEEEDADLIAIASHGRTGLSRVFYGSVAAGVLHAIDRPLLVIRSRNI